MQDTLAQIKINSELQDLNVIHVIFFQFRFSSVVGRS